MDEGCNSQKRERCKKGSQVSVGGAKWRNNVWRVCQAQRVRSDQRYEQGKGPRKQGEEFEHHERDREQVKALEEELTW